MGGCSEAEWSGLVASLTYISFERLGADWLEDAPCLVPADWVIEIISPNQTFGGMAAKASDYLTAGVLRVWILDSEAQTSTIAVRQAVRTFFISRNLSPLRFKGEMMLTQPPYLQ